MWLYVGKVFQVEGTVSSKVLRGQKGPLRSEGSMVRKEEQPRHNVRASWSVCERGVKVDSRGLCKDLGFTLRWEDRGIF